MRTKIVLWVTGIGFSLYGLACLIDPNIPAGYIGYQLTGGDAFIEVAGMYGGVQIGVGLLCILGALSSQHCQSSLLAIALIVGCLAAGRAYGLFANDLGDPTAYSYGAIFYEATTALLAWFCYRSQASGTA